LYELYLLADYRNYNLLLIAAELGDIYMVQFFLNGGFDTEAHDTNAQTLAYKGRHFDILLALLKSNLRYPQEINIQECPDNINDFYKIRECLDEAMLAVDSEKVLEILDQNPEIRHFYNLCNESAPAFALKHKLFDMYRLLISKNKMIGAHEKFSEIKMELKENERKELREIHYEESKFLPDNHMHVLMSNSRLAPGTTQHEKKYEIIRKAFEILNENPLTQILLMVVAASRNFRIVFDFNQNSVEHIDPTANASEVGLFYTSGRIYVAAKHLLNPKTKFDALGTLAHELCHHAMNLVYKNMANPYVSSDSKTEHKFDEISSICEKNQDKEEVIKWVYKNYQPNIQHAELIVRVPHLIMKYFENLETFVQIRLIFSDLFEIYEKKLVGEMHKALPKIEAQRNKKKIRNLTVVSVFVCLLAIIGIISGVYVTWSIFYTPTYRFSELSNKDKMSVFEAPISFRNVELEFRDLFPENSTAYGDLTSDHILQMLNGKLMNLSDPHLSYLEEQVTLKWESLAKNLKQKFLSSNFTFQNESLKLERIYENNSEVFNSLSSDQILEVLDEKVLVVHKMIKNGAKFYFERNITNENIREIYSYFMKYISGEKELSCSKYNETGSNKTFEAFYQEFISQNTSVQETKFKAIRKDKNYKECLDHNLAITTKDEPHNITNFSPINQFNQTLNIANKSKMFILSGEAGTGKTITFEQFTIRIKKNFPTQWVSYIDLKEYKELYGKIWILKDVQKMLEKIFGLSSENEFEKKIFQDSFYSGNLVLLWNGFDEVSPQFSADVIRILKLIRDETKNIQFVCTRPLYSELLRKKFETQSYTLVVDFVP